MDIKELDKKQLILLVLLITFVVSIATGIVTVSLMNQMPKNVPQTINNVIQRTIEKVTTVETPVSKTVTSTDNTKTTNDESSLFSTSGDTLIDIYLNNKKETTTSEGITTEATPAIGQGIIISDIGLVLIDSSLINDLDSYKVVLDKKDFSVSVLKKFSNGFTVLKISPIKETVTETTDTTIKTQ